MMDKARAMGTIVEWLNRGFSEDKIRIVFSEDHTMACIYIEGL